MYSNENIKKVCSFCVSDLHLITMLLPYLNKKIKEKEKVVTILEKDLEEQTNLVLSRLTLNEEEKLNLLNINWNRKIIYNFKMIEEEVNKICKNNKGINVIINGSKEYIEAVNKKLSEMFSSLELQGEIKVINCYDITKLDEDIKDILKSHDTILNTSGEKQISEVFEGYEKQKGA